MVEQDRGTKLYTRREFGALALKAAAAGATAGLAAFAPGEKARGDGGVVTPEKPNPCLYAHPEGHPEINLNRPLLRFSVVTFPDQEEGLRFLRANWSRFLEGIQRRVGELQAFYSGYYPNFRASWELKPEFLESELPLREHWEQRREGLAVDRSGIVDKFYNGVEFPAHTVIFITNPNVSQQDVSPYPGQRGGFKGNSGWIQLSWHIFFGNAPIHPFEPILKETKTLLHEFGHAAFGWGHHPGGGTGNIMSAGFPPPGYGFRLDAAQVQNTTGRFGCRNYLPGVFGRPIPYGGK